MRIFIAGATGVLGRRVVPAFVAEGHTVTAVARSAGREAMVRAHGATPVRLDLFDRDAVRGAVAGSDVVINLATAIPSTGQMLRRSAWRMTDRLRTEAAGNLVDGAMAAGAQRYVQEALAFVYPDRGAVWIDEDTPLDPPPSAVAVEQAEAHVRRFAASGGAGVALRFGMFYAADADQTQDLVRALRYGLIALPERPDAHRPWVHVDDAAAAVSAALDVPSGAYNVVEDQPLTGREHRELLQALAGRRLWRVPSALAVGLLRFQLRSLRVSNGRLRDRSSWRPAFDRRAGWSEVLRTAAREASHA